MTELPPRPKDPELAELHDIAVEIRDRNTVRRDIERTTWIVYALSFVLIFIPGRLATLFWLLSLLLGIGLTVYAGWYQSKTHRRQHDLYEKASRQARQSALGIIDRVKAALPEKDVTIAHNGNIMLQDKKEGRE